MKKFAVITALATCLAVPTMSGCSEGAQENTVIEAPPANEEEPAIEGMTDEEYNAAMEAEMQGE